MSPIDEGVGPTEPGGAAVDRSGAESRSVLIIGFGNTLRRDDGVGARAAAQLSVDPRFAGDAIEVQERYQLVPEMALDVGACSLVIFIDADLRGLPGSISVRSLEADAARSDADARPQPGASSHHVGGGELVALAELLVGRRPEALEVGIGVADLDAGEDLTPAVEASLTRVADVVAELVARHLSPGTT